MTFEEKTLSKEAIYEGKIINVEKHKVLLPNNETSYREVVKHNGAVAVCALTPDNEVILVRQYRKPMDEVLLEIPAGKLEPGEDRMSAAKRELEEETGYKTESLILIGEVYGSQGSQMKKYQFTLQINYQKEKFNWMMMNLLKKRFIVFLMLNRQWLIKKSMMPKHLLPYSIYY